MRTLRIGFLGLGAMGSAMACRLVDAGHHVSVYNRTTAKADEVAARGATVSADPAGAARDADVLMLSLATADVVDELLFAAGALAATAPGAVVADMTTVSAGDARAFAARVAESGRRALDACVLGNARHAADGELRFMIGGDEADVTALRPALDVLGKEVVHLGGHGMGATAKVAMNLLMGVQLQAVAEAVILGERAGLPRQQLISMIAASGYSSPMLRFKSGVMARRAFDRADFRLALMRKDLMLALGEAQRLGVPMPATAASFDVLTSATNAGLGDLDCAAVLVEVERMAGVTAPPAEPGRPGPGGASGRPGPGGVSGRPGPGGAP